MGIIARYSHAGNENLPTPGRLYLQRTSDVFNGSTSSPIKNAALYAQDVLTRRSSTMRDFVYFIGILWGKERVKALDLFGYKDIDPKSTGEPWQRSNPDIGLWVIKNGVWVSEGGSCEDSVIILGREGEHRRKTSGLAEFIETFPNLRDLEPVDERYTNLKLWTLPQQV